MDNLLCNKCAWFVGFSFLLFASTTTPMESLKADPLKESTINTIVREVALGSEKQQANTGGITSGSGGNGGGSGVIGSQIPTVQGGNGEKSLIRDNKVGNVGNIAK